MKMDFKTIAVFLGLIALLGGIAFYMLRGKVRQGGVDVGNLDYPITGIDVSAHNGDIDFAKVKNDGVSFVLVKATEGQNFRDSRFEENFRNASDNGLFVGAYHFFRFDVDGVEQARNFMSVLKNKHLAFPVVLDVEEHGNPFIPVRSIVIRRLQDMIDELTINEYPIMIYTNKNGYDKFIAGNFDDYPLWICSFTEPVKDIDWTLWQYSHWGEVDGISGDVDMNLFYGNGDQWREWMQ